MSYSNSKNVTLIVGLLIVSVLVFTYIIIANTTTSKSDIPIYTDVRQAGVDTEDD